MTQMKAEQRGGADVEHYPPDVLKRLDDEPLQVARFLAVEIGDEALIDVWTESELHDVHDEKHQQNDSGDGHRARADALPARASSALVYLIPLSSRLASARRDC